MGCRKEKKAKRQWRFDLPGKNHNPMIFERIKSGIAVNDREFDKMYSNRLKKVSEFHFTPVNAAKCAARFLVDKPGARVLDIGSGAGKFCMVGAASTGGHFTGVEQRESLYRLSEELASHYRLSNLRFICSNITEIKFKEYDAIYFFNSFFENIVPGCAIDAALTLDKQHYDTYSAYVKTQLDAMPAGTRLATYFSYSSEIPDSYHQEMACFDGKMKLWIKTI